MTDLYKQVTSESASFHPSQKDTPTGKPAKGPASKPAPTAPSLFKLKTAKETGPKETAPAGSTETGQKRNRSSGVRTNMKLSSASVPPPAAAGRTRTKMDTTAETPSSEEDEEQSNNSGESGNEEEESDQDGSSGGPTRDYWDSDDSRDPDDHSYELEEIEEANRRRYFR